MSDDDRLEADIVRLAKRTAQGSERVPFKGRTYVEYLDGLAIFTDDKGKVFLVASEQQARELRGESDD